MKQAKEKPMLFSGPMVRAILDGSKTQTRRLVKSQPQPNGGAGLHPVAPYQNPHGAWAWVLAATGHSTGSDMFLCPCGSVGDQLWVRETFYAYGRWITRYSEKKKRDEWHFIDMTVECDRAYQYAADNPQLPWGYRGSILPGWHKRPAIFMPRIASRIELEIKGVRVQRLQAISEMDAKAEGAPGYEEGIDPPSPDDQCEWSYQASFRRLWESINGASSWTANPWCWVIEFERITK